MKRFLVLCCILAASAHLSQVWGAEHPAEHPSGGTKQSGSSKKQSALSKEDMAWAIEAYVKKETALKGGYFLVYDKVAKKPLVLALDRVHKDRLSRVGAGVYFACADFRTPEGKVYDLDVFMKGPDKKHMKVTEISVHKEDGKARYTWYEKRGIWKKKHAGSAKKESASSGNKAAEHPAEHPQ